MKIVFFNIPAHGHTNPTLGVVKELIKNNHDVYYYSYEIMREKIESSGAHFIPCDKFDSQTKLSNEDKEKIAKDLVFSTNLIVDMTLRLDDEILREMQELKPDVIIADSMAFWGKLIAKKLNIPFISSTTTFAFNKYSARVMKQDGPGLFQLIKSVPKINKSLNRLREKGYEVKDFGCHDLSSCDYPDYAKPAARAVADGTCEKGIVICTTGIGISITANKFKGVRCALCSDCFSAEATRLHNDANVLALGAGVVGELLALRIVDTFLNTEFSNVERHINRVKMIEE